MKERDWERDGGENPMFGLTGFSSIFGRDEE
jgi:hypothetical protein